LRQTLPLLWPPSDLAGFSFVRQILIVAVYISALPEGHSLPRSYFPGFNRFDYICYCGSLIARSLISLAEAVPK
jgi:hypothetical protein